MFVFDQTCECRHFWSTLRSEIEDDSFERKVTESNEMEIHNLCQCD